MVIYPWPFELLDNKVRNKYLSYINLKFNEKDIDNLVIYDKFIKGNVADNILKFYLPKDVHYNKFGNKVLSDELFKKIYTTQ